MTPPPIRYPLPTLILLIVVGILVWKGEQWSRPFRAAARAKIERAVSGPPVPASSVAKTKGEIPRRGLPLRDSVPVFRKPNGEPLSPLEKRGFVSIYDEWSSRGETAPAEFYRVGTRVAIGWIAAADLLSWDTRLVVKPPSGMLKLAPTPGGPAAETPVGTEPVPIVGWDEQEIEIQTWSTGSPWDKPGARGWIKPGDLPEGSIGVLVGQVELPSLLAGAVAAKDEASAARVRLQAVLGEIVNGKTRTDAEVSAAFRQLPPLVNSRRSTGSAAEKIAALNAGAAKPEVKLGDRPFRFAPLEILP